MSTAVQQGVEPHQGDKRSRTSGMRLPNLIVGEGLAIAFPQGIVREHKYTVDGPDLSQLTALDVGLSMAPSLPVGASSASADETELMVIFHDSRRFELTVEAQHDAWTARFYEWVPGRLQPTLHVLRSFARRDDAIEAMRRKWHGLWPDAEPLMWRDPTVRETHPSVRKRPRSMPREP